MSPAGSRACRALTFCVVAFLVFGALSCKVEDRPSDRTWDALVADSHHWLDRDGYRMHYVDVGEGSPVVMIHGFADSTYCWYANAQPLLDAGYRLILVDLPGFGKSDIPPAPLTLTAMNMGEEVIALIDHLGLERFSLVGSSMGGAVSLWISYRLPHRVARTVALDPASYWQRKSGFLALIDVPGTSLVMGRWAVKAALQDVYYDKTQVTDTLVDEYARALSKKGYAQYLVRVLDDFDSPEAVRFSERYGEIDVPVLVIWGKYDRWVPPEFGPRLAADLPDARLKMIDESGHLPHQERPALVNPLILEFLAE